MKKNGLLNFLSANHAIPGTIQEYLSDNIAFYYAEPNKGNEYFSNKLIRTFRLDEGSSFNDFLKYFNEEDITSIEAIINEIEDDREFTYTLKTIEGKKYFECFGNIINLKDKGRKVLLVFADVTNKVKDSQENVILKRQSRDFKEIINHLPIPIWKRGKNLKISYFNLAYSKILGGNFEDIKQSEEIELSPDIKKVAARALETREQQDIEQHLIINKERKLYKFIEIPSDEGTIGFAYEISEQEEIRNELSRYISSQSDLLESSTSAMAVFSPDTRIKFFNSAFVNLWKLEERWLDSLPTFSEILEALREKRKLPEQSNFQQFKQKRIKFFTDLLDTFEEFFYLPDGKTLRVVYIPQALGGLLMSFEDITDKLALERSFKSMLAVRKVTLDNLEEGVALFGEDGRIKLFNPIYAKMWNLDPEFLESHAHIADILEKTRPLYRFEEDWTECKKNIISRTMSRDSFSEKISRNDGRVLSWKCFPLPDGGILMTYDDVTDSHLVEKSLRERYEALEQVDTLKSKFLTNVSYELRSPLTNIMGFSEMMLNAKYFGELGQKQREYIESIHESSLNLAELIDGILDIASVEAGYMKLNITEMHILDTLEEIDRTVSDRLERRGLKFDIVCPKDIGNIKADVARIKQVILKLIDNSAKYTPSGGKITLGAEKIGTNEVVIYIEDTGQGIPEKEQLAVFEKFYKLPPLKKEKEVSGYGIGLGLSIAKSLIELHGGRIELTSKVGVGTKVSCYLYR